MRTVKRIFKKENLAALAAFGVVGGVGGFALAAPTIASVDDTSTRHGNHAEPGDDHGRHHDAQGRRHHGEPEPGDDRMSGVAGHGEAEPGDDHGRQHDGQGGRHHNGEAEPGDDNGGHGSDD
jgi:hypothetical protein